MASSIDYEAQLIEELNEVLVHWREEYDTLEEAAVELLGIHPADYPGYSSYVDDGELQGELNFEDD